MEIKYTDYAEMKVAKRQIPKTQIKNALANPDNILEGKEGRKIAQKIQGKYLLRIVFEKHGNIYKVITVYYSKPERYT